MKSWNVYFLPLLYVHTRTSCVAEMSLLKETNLIVDCQCLEGDSWAFNSEDRRKLLITGLTSGSRAHHSHQGAAVFTTIYIRHKYMVHALLFQSIKLSIEYKYFVFHILISAWVHLSSVSFHVFSQSQVLVSPNSNDLRGLMPICGPWGHS